MENLPSAPIPDLSVLLSWSNDRSYSERHCAALHTNQSRPMSANNFHNNIISADCDMANTSCELRESSRVLVVKGGPGSRLYSEGV